jgi:hypothetical protein
VRPAGRFNLPGVAVLRSLVAFRHFVHPRSPRHACRSLGRVEIRIVFGTEEAAVLCRTTPGKPAGLATLRAQLCSKLSEVSTVGSSVHGDRRGSDSREKRRIFSPIEKRCSESELRKFLPVATGTPVVFKHRSPSDDRNYLFPG